MSITRRTLLLGAGTGAVAVLLAACTPEPAPRPTKTKTPAPRPTAPSNVPKPAAWVRSTWASDPYSIGSRSYLPAGADPSHRTTLAEPILDRLFFAGEATDATRPGTVIGAVDSGRRAALAAIASTSSDERIAVIGAGASGVVAARMLADAGHDVTILEARERAGGRILSEAGDEWPIPPQLGAWLLDPDDIAAIADRVIEITDDTVAFDSATGWTAEGATDSIDLDPLAQALQKAADLPADVPLTEALTAGGADPEDPALAASLAWIAATTAADPTRASSWYPPELTPDALQGFNGDLGAFIADHLDDLEVTRASPVVRVAYDDRGVSLRLGTGEALSYDRVIVTVPIGVLQNQGIEFAPALPFRHRGAIAALGSGFLETVWVRFDEAFWDTEARVWHVIGGDGMIRTWLNLQPETGEPVLVGLVGAEAAQQFAELNERDALAVVRSSLTYFAPPADEE